MTKNLGTALGAALTSAALLLCAPLAGTAQTAAAPVSGTLDGGGTYIVKVQGGAPVAAVALWYRAPAAGFDAAPVPGLGRIAATAVAGSVPITGTSLGTFVQRIGGRLAITAYPESVAVSAIVPANRAADTVKAMTRAFFSPVLTDAGLATARRDLTSATILHALSSDSAVDDALYNTLFASGPAKTPTFAPRAVLSSMTLDRVRTYAERAFRPGNAVLVVTGAVMPDVVKSATRGPQGAAAGVESPTPATLGPVAILETSRSVPGLEPGFGMAWAGPSIADEREATALDFIADYLFYPDTGTVQRAVRSTGTSVTGTFVTYHDPGVFLFSATGGDVVGARAIVTAGLDSVRKPLDAGAFAAAVRTFTYHILSDDQTPSELADTFGWYAVEGNPRYAPGEGIAGRYFSAASSLTPQFVAATAVKYLDRAHAVVDLAPARPAGDVK